MTAHKPKRVLKIGDVIHDFIKADGTPIPFDVSYGGVVTSVERDGSVLLDNDKEFLDDPDRTCIVYVLDDDGNAVEASFPSDIVAEVRQLRAALDHVVGLGHNDDCLFCGLKDRAASEAMGEQP